jgi:glycerol-3-phosphate acyltransferase PlsX
VKIAVDAMGGDDAPKTIVEGVERARDEKADLEFILYGDEQQIKPLLKSAAHITIVHTDEKIEQDEHPVKAVRKKKNASLVLAAHAVKDGEADALFSAGSTGALLAAGLFIVGRIKGIDRPGLMPTLPAVNNDHGFVMLDVGANADNRPGQLQQYAIMGNFYARDVRKIDNPRVGLLNNGSEATKGDELHQEAHKLLDETDGLNFIGNIESNGLLDGVADVVVTDGFTGNAVLKSIEGTSHTLLHEIKHTIMNSGVRGLLGGALLKKGIGSIVDKFDASRYGGAVLLGLKAPVIKAHGAADARTVYYTVLQIREMLEQQTITKFIDYFNEHDIATK